MIDAPRAMRLETVRVARRATFHFHRQPTFLSIKFGPTVVTSMDKLICDRQVADPA